MAVTKIWPIRTSIAAPINYVINTDKTSNPGPIRDEIPVESYQALEDVIEYAANEDKTEMKYFVTTLNCNKRFARDEFLTVKKRFGKEGGIVAFHAYQSFNEGEVNPSQAHHIGVQLAREIWGDRFQVVVATHVNTKCVHNHFVINSVSFRDGKRYHDSRETYALLRHTSDKICLEHGLTVIENPKGKGVNKYLYRMEREGRMTRYNVARKAIDEAIALSLDLDEFKSELRKRGYYYRFDDNRKYWTITPPGWKKSIRVYKLGEDYSEASIMRRLYENEPELVARNYRKEYHRTSHYNLRRRIDHIMGRSGLEKLYLRYCYELGYLPKYKQNPTKLHILLKEDLLKCDMYSEQAKLLARYHISTNEDLLLHIEEASGQIQALGERRDELRKVIKRVLPESEIENAKAEITELTAGIKNLRRELKVCRLIEERSGHVRENMEIIDRDRRKERYRDDSR